MRDNKKVGQKRKKKEKEKEKKWYKLYIFILIIKHRIINGCLSKINLYKLEIKKNKIYFNNKERF